MRATTVALAAVIVTSACAAPQTPTARTPPVATAGRSTTPTPPVAVTGSSPTARQLSETDAQREVGPSVRETLMALKTRNSGALSAMAHPSKGVLFSTQSYVLPASNVTLTAAQLANAFTDPTIRTWGRSDGRGDLIEKNFSDYHAVYIYGRDFAGAQQTAYNRVIGTGNSTDNTATVYPDAVLFEAYDPGPDPSVNWQALRLLFERSGGRWYLVAVVHGEWTI